MVIQLARRVTIVNATVDTGESIGLGASKLTITFGISKSLMKKIGLSLKFPMPLKIYRIFRMIS